MNDSNPIYDRTQVLYWEGVLKKELSLALSLMEKKKQLMESLRDLPFERKNKKTNKLIKELEKDISMTLGLIATTEQLKGAYVNFTASVADKLSLSNAQRDIYFNKVIDLMTEGGVDKL